MDVATVAGIIVGFSLVILAMASGGGLNWFLDAPAAMIVLGGTFGAILINYPLGDIAGVFKAIKYVFFQRELHSLRVIDLLVRMSQTTRREGILGMERMSREVDDPFLKKAIEFMVDGAGPDELNTILVTELEYVEERHRLGAEIFTTMGHFAPAMGMMGTLIGLIQMLMRMNEPSTIGPSMAVALVTTFYGVILSNLIFLPVAGKLRTRSARELLVKQLIINGVLSIQSGDNPRVVEKKLHSFIAPQERRSVFFYGKTAKKRTSPE
ncbi:MAG: motility protein A [Pseudomonadota bacterium]